MTNEDCIEWPGSRLAEGYGYFRTPQKDGSKGILAHRFIYEVIHGPIPDDLVVRHTCDNPPCVNPEHLLLGTQANNVQDMMDRGRWGAFGKFEVPLQTHCLRGHEFTDENTYLSPKGSRICKECTRIRSREYYQRKNPGSRKKSDTHCPQGHELTEDNLYRAPSRPGVRICLTCKNLANAAQRAKRKQRKS